MNCKATTKTGKPCRMPAIGAGKFCFTHSPATRTAQAQARKLGGHNTHTPHAGNAETVSSSPRSIPEAMTILDYALAETLAADNSIPRTRALIAIASGYIDAIKTGEIEAQLKELLAILAGREGMKA